MLKKEIRVKEPSINRPFKTLKEPTVLKKERPTIKIKVWFMASFIFQKTFEKRGLNKYTRTYLIFDSLRTEAMKPNNRSDNRQKPVAVLSNPQGPHTC